jgi:dipeptidase
MRWGSLCCLALVTAESVERDHSEERIGCTAIAIDGAATVDGSAFAGMNADSGDADNRLTFVPPRSYEEGAMRDVFTFNLSYPRFVGYGRGDFFHPFPGHEVLYTRVGQIPEAKSTFGYYESTEPLMNEKGLGFGESSCAAMLNNRFADDASDTRDVPVGLLDTVTMMQLALERCETSRCAVELMGALAEEFGFVPTPGEPTKGFVKGKTAYDDAGEAYTIADASGEAWVFHVLGGVSGVTKSVWAAQRVPKGHIAVVANNFIIGDLPQEPTEDVLFNKAIFRAAKTAQLWSGDGPLHFTNVFSPDEMAFESPKGQAPIPLYASVRRFGVFNLVAEAPFYVRSTDYGFSLPVSKKLTHRDVMGLFRTQYEGTEFDLTQGILAGPYGNPFRSEGGPSFGQIPRGVSITRTVYSIFVQTGPKKSLAWYAQDTPVTSVYVPLLPETGMVSEPYLVGHNQEFTRASASWAFNFVSSYMQLNYRGMSKDDVYPRRERWQDEIDRRLARLESEEFGLEDRKKWQSAIQEELVADWWSMADFLVMKYNDGKVNWPKAGRSIGYPEDFARLVGFSNDVHPIWVQPAATPQVHVESYVPKSVQLPLIWDSPSMTWSYEDDALQAATQPSPAVTSSLGSVAATFVALCAGIALGRSFERRKVAARDAYLSLM